MSRKPNFSTFCLRPTDEERYLYMITRRGVCLYDTQTNTVSEQLNHTSAVRIGVSQSGKTLAALEWSKKKPKLIIFEKTAKMEQMATVVLKKPCLESEPVFGPDQHSVWVANNEGVTRYDLDSQDLSDISSCPADYCLVSFDIFNQMVGLLYQRKESTTEYLLCIHRLADHVSLEFPLINVDTILSFTFLSETSFVLSSQIWGVGTARSKIRQYYLNAKSEIILERVHHIPGFIHTFSLMKEQGICAYTFRTLEKRHIGICDIGEILELSADKTLLTRMSMQSWSCYCSDRTKKVYFCDTFGAYFYDLVSQEVTLIK